MPMTVQGLRLNHALTAMTSRTEHSLLGSWNTLFTGAQSTPSLENLPDTVGV